MHLVAGQTTIELGPDIDLDLPERRSERPDTLRIPPRRRRAAEPRIAIVHEWLDTYAGSERVLEQLLLCFPSADIFAVVDFMRPEERHFLQGRPVRTSFIQKLPFARHRFRNYLGLMPLAIQHTKWSTPPSHAAPVRA